MRRYLIDTGALSLLLSGQVPEKWRRPWEEVRAGRAWLVLIEPLVCELYYRSVPRLGRRRARERVLWLKSLRGSRISDPDDNDSMFAGDLKVDGRSDLSIVDCFLLAIAKSERTTVLTNDHSVRDVGRRLGIVVSWLPEVLS